MKIKFLNKFGKFLMIKNALSICIVDDEDAYFNPEMLNYAKAAGFPEISRYSIIDLDLFDKMINNPYDIVILDIKGIAHPDLAPDGFTVARLLFEKTNSYIVITSAHKFHLHQYHQKFDYMIPQRLLTIVDFIDELNKIVTDYARLKLKFYKKIGFKIGFKLVKASISALPE